MKYMIVYSSGTGNTEMIAEAIRDTLDEKRCIYYGKPSGISSQNTDIVLVGFWVFMGSCTEEIKKYLKTLENKKIFLFGTAGFGGSDSYFTNILTEVKKNIATSNTIIGSFMCQGKMQNNVLERYLKLLEEQPENNHIQDMIDNYKKATSHPDIHDIESIKATIGSTFVEL